MLERAFNAVHALQEAIADIPFLAPIAVMDATVLVYILLAVVSLLFVGSVAYIVRGICAIKRYMMYRHVEKFFDVPDLSQFTIRKMGKPGTKYYIEDGVNALRVSYPRWKHANEDGTKAKKRFNKIVWSESRLWLHAGKKVYVVCSNDPYAITYLAHTLREGGLDIPACQQELEKQEIIESKRRSIDDIVQDIIDEVGGNGVKFIELCRQRLSAAGYNVSDAPHNKDNITLFFRNGPQPNVVRCQLVQRDHLVGIDEIREFKDSAAALFVDACTLITTGRISIAAAGYARSNNVDIICNERLAEMMEGGECLPAEKAFRAWELTSEDISDALPADLIAKIF